MNLLDAYLSALLSSTHCIGPDICICTRYATVRQKAIAEQASRAEKMTKRMQHI